MLDDADLGTPHALAGWGLQNDWTEANLNRSLFVSSVIANVLIDAGKKH